jgi:hypothetical protein
LALLVIGVHDDWNQKLKHCYTIADAIATTATNSVATISGATAPNAVVYNVAATNVTPPAILLTCSTHFISCFYFQYINKKHY